MIPNDGRTGPAFPIFFALNMLLNTAKGDTYTLAEYRSWLTEAGRETEQVTKAWTESMGWASVFQTQ